MRILVATDGSPCSDRAIQQVAVRPWPAASEIELVSVIHTRIPNAPDLLMAVEASHVQALEAERQRVPARIERARRALENARGVTVTSKILEGDPEDEILKEADTWRADLIVLGSHGYGPVKRRLLGSVALAVALEASCSVEIARCRQAAQNPLAGTA
jgi:nucleotide-binding universal stress UspA family protein